MGAAAEATFLLALLAVVVRFCAQGYLSHRQIAAVRGSRGRVPPSFEATVTVEEHNKSCDYTLAKARLAVVAQAAEAVVAVALLSWGLALLGDMIVPENGVVAGALFVAAILAIEAMAGLPFDAWRQLKLEKRFGFGRMTPGALLADRLKGLAVALAIGGPLLAGILWTIDSAGALWWLLAWALLAAANILAAVIFPTLIAPLFNRFTPMEDGKLKERALDLLGRCGFSAAGLYVVDGSRRSRHSNAYFTGFGKSKRIVLYDTLIETLDTDEIAAVLAHELGHFKLRHIATRICWSLAVSLAFFAALGWLFSAEWFFEAFGLAPSAGAGLGIAMLLAPAAGFPLSGVFSALSRKHEFEADAFAADLESAGALESALLKLYRDNAAPLAPDALYSKFYESHPPASIRLARLRACATA